MNIKPGTTKIFLFLVQFMVAGLLTMQAQDSLLDVVETADEDSVKIGLLIQVADNYSRADSTDLARKYYREAISLATRTNHSRFRALALDKLGTLVRRTGLYDQSLEYHLEAMELATKLGEKQLLATIYDHIGVVYRRKTEDNLALKYHLMALTTAEEIQDTRTIAYSCNSIGIIYAYQKNYQEAQQYFERALSLAKKHNNPDGVAINLNCIAWVHEMKEEYDLAIDYFERSLAVNENSGNLEGMAICYNDLGKLYRTIGEYNKSLEYYRKTLEIHESRGDLLHVATNRINLGQVYADLGEYQRSLSELYSVLDLAKQLGSKRLLMDCYEQLSKTHEELGHFESSLFYLKNYAAYRDSIYNEESSRQIAEFKTLFDTEKKEKENIMLAAEKHALDAKVKRQRLTVIGVSAFLLLFTVISVYLFLIRRKLLRYQEKINHQNEQLIENEKKLNEMIATKDKFFKIIAHDLRNHFNGLLGYSELLVQTHREMDVDERDSMINDISDISKNTFSLLENLLVWSRSQTENLPFSPKTYRLPELVDANLTALQSLVKAKRLQLTSTIGKDIRVYADREMLNTVLRNLIMNAIKFSHERDEIRLDAEQENGTVRISIRDQGIGMSPEKLEILFDITQKTSTLGTDQEKGTGLGLALCKEFIDTHGGQILVDSKEGKGSVFTVILDSEKPGKK
jgi:signal transduction histidine kinase/Tfp pilus assembly protein PilF